MIDRKLYKDLQDKIEEKAGTCSKSLRPYVLKMRGNLVDPSFCRAVMPDRFGGDFRDFQYKYEAVFNAAMSAALEALSDAKDESEYEEISYGLLHWVDTAKLIFGV
ncbi:MAG: hypothetical protein LUD29_06485 [Clostridia bacterium]|nr:hypothetical protein [Clostridia bacterium]